MSDWACVGSVDTQTLGITMPGKESMMAKMCPLSLLSFQADPIELTRTSG